MKKFIYALFAAVLLAGFATSCSDDDNVTTYYKLAVTLDAADNVSFTSGSVTVTNTQTGRTYSSDEVLTTYEFELPGGTYNVQASMRANNGASVVSYSAAREIAVFEDATVALQLESSVSGGLIFKEVYYNMVRPNGKNPYMRDQFFEIYNNSDETLYLDNCVLGILEGSQGKLPSAWKDADGELMKEYPLNYYTVAFVGDGTTYPLAPGKSVVIASVAQNHKEQTADAYNPEVAGAKMSPVDLSHADFEVCLMDYKPAVSIDNPDVPNMTIIAVRGTQNYFTLPYTGNAIILAKLPAGVDPIAYGADQANYKARPDGVNPSLTYLMIPQEYVLDGLNIVNNADKADQQVVRLRAEVDAGVVFNEAAYCGKSIRRKVERIADDGRAIFKDTNNSTEDFLRNQEPTPGVIPTVAD